MGGKLKKQYLMLGDVPVLSRTLMKFEACQFVDEIILVVPREDRKYCLEHIISPFNINKPLHVVDGGKERQDSVYNGLKKSRELAAKDENTIVLIHDGVRPFIEEKIIIDCIEKAVKHGGCIPGIRITDTVKRVGHDSQVTETMNREYLCVVQTPQTFKLELILSAYEYGYKTFFSGTDDASFVEHLGERVHVTAGSKFNIKLTTSDDLILGEQILSKIRK